jgi:hypothetical protein
MAIPTGTTARQIGAIARWTLAGVVIAGMLAWWWPGYRAWGATAAALAVVLTLWLLWRIVLADRSLPGHPVYVALLGPALILGWHLARTGFVPAAPDAPGLAGALNISMIYQMALLAVGILLVQSLLPRAAAHAGVLSVCGLAMIAGSAIAIFLGRPHTHVIRGALTMMGCSGIGVWLAPLWGVPRQPSDDGPMRPHPLHHPAVRCACLLAAAGAVVVMAAFAPYETMLAACIAAVVVLLNGVIFHRSRRKLLAVGGALTAGAAVAAVCLRPALPNFGGIQDSWFGRGEQAFANVSAADSGFVVLADMIGWAGVAWLTGGLGICIVGMMIRARSHPPADQARATAWTVATALAGAAILMPGGLFFPSATLAAALTWGLLPMMLGRSPRKRPGVLLLGATLAMMGLIGLSRSQGLPFWSAMALSGDKNFLHGPAGFLLAMMVAWLMGARNVWLGLVGIAAVAAAGGAAEWLQSTLVSWRGSETQDWVYHAVGAAAAMLPYLLAVGSRLCESPDVRPKRDLETYGRR